MARKRQRGNGQGTLFQRDGSGPWVAKWYDHNGERQERSTKTTDKRAAERVLAKWCADATLRREGVVDARAEALAVQGRRPIAEHLADFKAGLLAKGTTPRHATYVHLRARRILNATGCKRWANVSANRAMEYLRSLQADQEVRNEAGEVEKVIRGISAQTFNFYLQALKQFGRWMVKDRRAVDNPFAYLEPLNVRLDRRHDRRAFTPDELRTLIATTEAGPEHHGMTGPERAILYRMAAETGLRAGELRSLTRASFKLDPKAPTVTVGAAYSKRRRQDVQPMRPELADDLGAFLADKLPGAPVFRMPVAERQAVMLRVDLAAAGIPYRDDAGRVADFHALRHTFISNLAAGGVYPKVAQTLARHSTITLTMDRYTHQRVGDEAAALAVLPDLTMPAAVLAANGTDGKPVNAIHKSTTPTSRPTSRPTSSRAKWCTPNASRCDESGQNSQVTGGESDDRKPCVGAGLHECTRPDATTRDDEGGGFSAPGNSAGCGVFQTVATPPKTPVNVDVSELPPPVDPPVGCRNTPPADPDLARLVDAWPELPEAIKAGIVALVAAL